MSTASVPFSHTRPLEAASTPGRRPSVARVVVVVALAIQILGIAYAIFVQVGLDQWIQTVQQGDGPLTAGTVVFLGSLALVYPALRAGRWS